MTGKLQLPHYHHKTPTVPTPSWSDPANPTCDYILWPFVEYNLTSCQISVFCLQNHRKGRSVTVGRFSLPLSLVSPVRSDQTTAFVAILLGRTQQATVQFSIFRTLWGRGGDYCIQDKQSEAWSSSSVVNRKQANTQAKSQTKNSQSLIIIIICFAFKLLRYNKSYEQLLVIISKHLNWHPLVQLVEVCVSVGLFVFWDLQELVLDTQTFNYYGSYGVQITEQNGPTTLALSYSNMCGSSGSSGQAGAAATDLSTR